MTIAHTEYGWSEPTWSPSVYVICAKFQHFKVQIGGVFKTVGDLD